jgi:hypothetical protein
LTHMICQGAANIVHHISTAIIVPQMSNECL